MSATTPDATIRQPISTRTFKINVSPPRLSGGNRDTTGRHKPCCVSKLSVGCLLGRRDVIKLTKNGKARLAVGITAGVALLGLNGTAGAQAPVET